MTFQNEQTPLVSSDSSSASIPIHHEQRSNGSEDAASAPMRRKDPLVLFIFTMLFLGLASYINSIGTDVSAALNLLKLKKTMHNNEDEPQLVAQHAFQDNLVRPSYEAELFYHPTQKENKHPVMGSSLGSKPKVPPPEGCHGTVIIIRHCEKGSIREHCNTIGFERAEYISSLFGSEPEARWPAPSYLFALAPGERHNTYVNNWREVETIQPLSDKIGVPIYTSFGMDHKKDFAKHLFQMLRSGEMCGKVALVSWKHEDIPHLARSLGCGPDDGCPKSWASDNDFDSTWQVLYSYHKQMYPNFAIEVKKNKHKVWGQHPQWWISGHIQKEGFDPLQFRKNNGSY